MVRRMVDKGPLETMRDEFLEAVATAALANCLVRCAIYARYSSDNQRKSSIDDQIRNCRELAARKGCVIVEEHIYTDSEKTGTTVHGRTGLARLMDAAKSQPKPFDYILVDDTSRLGRNKADVFKHVDILNFHKVWLYFVEGGLDSSEPWFDNAFTNNAQRDQEYSKSLAHKVRRGKRGRFLAGYHPGNLCYGYMNVPDEDPTRRGEYGRPAVRGVWQVINPEEARIVVRIFEAYASGMSLRDIAKMLNAEGVPTAMGSRTGRRAYWCRSAIAEIIRNRRYLGETTWGRSYQERNPETGKMVTRYVDKAQWDQITKPELRIISDELFERVQQQLQHATYGLGVKQLGGMSRAKNGRQYILSGLLKCDACKGPMIITTTNPSRYGCARHRESNTCSNKTTIRADVLEERFIAALSQNLLSEDLREELVRAMWSHLRESAKAAAYRLNAAVGNRVQMEEERKSFVAQIKNVTNAIKDGGHSPWLLEELRELDAKVSHLDEALAALAVPPQKDITEDEVRGFLDSATQRLKEILSSNPEAVRNEFRRRITSITLTPSEDEHGPVYKVTGDVDLFVTPKDVAQSNQPELVGLRYTLPIALEIAPYRNRQKRASDSLAKPLECAVPLAEPDSPIAGVSQEFDEDEDAIWREVMAMDVQAFLDSGIELLREAGALKPWQQDLAYRQNENSYLYLPGFGGLHLAAIAA